MHQAVYQSTDSRGVVSYVVVRGTPKSLIRWKFGCMHAERSYYFV